MVVLNKLGRCVCKLSNPFAAGGCPCRTGHALGPHGVCTNDGKQDKIESNKCWRMCCIHTIYMLYYTF